MKDWKPGDIVYHVANHNVRGVIIPYAGPRYEEHVLVTFDEGVNFAEGQSNKKTWYCSANLLYSTSEEAKMNHICQEDPCWNCTSRHIKDIIT